MLSCHPEALVSDELDVLELLSLGFNRDQIFALIWDQDRRHQKRGRKKGGYDYLVPGSFQGQSKQPLIVGDAKGGASVSLLAQSPHLLDQLKETLGMPVIALAYFRNPFDTIATTSKRNRISLTKAVEQYFDAHYSLLQILEQLSNTEKKILFHEQVIDCPRESYSDLFQVLNIPINDDVIDPIVGKYFRKPKLTRRSARWPTSLLKDVKHRVADDSLLSAYGFDD
jgi:hypothetical protein